MLASVHEPLLDVLPKYMYRLGEGQLWAVVIVFSLCMMELSTDRRDAGGNVTPDAEERCEPE
jgi:hypothetical protein